MKLTVGEVQTILDEATRGRLTSLPLKLRFGVAHGMYSLEEVEEWMCKTRRDFEALAKRLGWENQVK